MRINVTSVGKPWKATPTSDPLWTITIDGQGEPCKTFDPEIATMGEHEAEEFTSKTGKSYWRTPKASNPGIDSTPRNYSKPTEKQFKGDPDTRDSIQKQKALAEAVNFTRDMGERATVEYTLSVATDFLKWLIKPYDPMIKEVEILDLPPVEVYEGQDA